MSQTIDIKFQELLICTHRRATNLPIQSPHNAKPHSNKGNPVLICPSIGRCHGSTTPSKGLCPQICSRSMPTFFRENHSPALGSPPTDVVGPTMLRYAMPPSALRHLLPVCVFALVGNTRARLCSPHISIQALDLRFSNFRDRFEVCYYWESPALLHQIYSCYRREAPPPY